MPSRPPLNNLRFLFRSFDAHREPVSLGQEQTVSSWARQQPPLQVVRQVKGVANGAYGRGVLLEEELEGGVLQQGSSRVSRDGAGGVLAEEVLDVLG